MDPLNLVRLTELMARTSGSPAVKIGLVDGPVMTEHPDLTGQNFRQLGGHAGGTCTRANSTACLHGTFVAGILAARRTSAAPAICPECTLIVRPIFPEMTHGAGGMPSAAPEELATAILECMEAGARVINLSLALAQPSTRGEQALESALNLLARRGVVVVAAAGNQGTLGSSAITRHPSVIPVVACDLGGRPVNQSNLGSSIGKRGLRAPGDRITSLGPDRTLTLGGTSVAVPFVTGAIALLLSAFPAMTAAQVKLAVIQPARRRAAVVPPLLDADAAFRFLSAT